eukprot:134520-Amphidinium_carterae.2
MESADSERKRKFQEQRGREKQRIGPWMPYGGEPIKVGMWFWHLYGVRETWSDFRDEVRDIRGIPMGAIPEIAQCELREEKLVLAEWTNSLDCQRHALEVCERAIRQQIPFKLCCKCRQRMQSIGRDYSRTKG